MSFIKSLFAYYYLYNLVCWILFLFLFAFDGNYFCVLCCAGTHLVATLSKRRVVAVFVRSVSECEISISKWTHSLLGVCSQWGTCFMFYVIVFVAHISVFMSCERQPLLKVFRQFDAGARDSNKSISNPRATVSCISWREWHWRCFLKR